MNTNTSPSVTTPGWLDALAARSLGDVEITPDLDLMLSRDALLARHAAPVRNQLLEALAMKIARFCSRFRRRDLSPWSFDDVEQEAYLAFVDVLDTWSPLVSPDGPAGFGYYFLRVFPMRLAGRVRVLLREETLTVGASDAHLALPDPTEIEETILVNQVINEICGHLNSLDREIFQLSVRNGLGPTRIADLTHVNRRTIQRHWPTIVSIVRERLREAS